MKKIFLLIFLLIFIFGSLPWNNSLISAAEKNEQKIYLWANDLSRKPEDPPYLSLYYRFRKVYFSVDPHADHSIVFLGDSITDEGDWPTLFPNLPVENRGIGGDTTLGVLNRLDQIVVLKPSKIFLMIGTNDLCFGRSIPDITSNYRRILNRLQIELPETKVYIQSVLPFNDTLFPSRSLRTNSNIQELNIQIKSLAQEYNYTYIDLTPTFTGQDGRLQARYTRDGLHLNETGYLLWRDTINNIVIK